MTSLVIKYVEVEIKSILMNNFTFHPHKQQSNWLSTSIQKRSWRKYAQSDSNTLLYNYLTGNLEIIKHIPCSLFMLKQFRESGVTVLMLKVCSSRCSTEAWEGLNWTLEEENQTPGGEHWGVTSVRADLGTQRPPHWPTSVASLVEDDKVENLL